MIYTVKYRVGRMGNGTLTELLPISVAVVKEIPTDTTRTYTIGKLGFTFCNKLGGRGIQTGDVIDIYMSPEHVMKGYKDRRKESTSYRMATYFRKKMIKDYINKI